MKARTQMIAGSIFGMIMGLLFGYLFDVISPPALPAMQIEQVQKERWTVRSIDNNQVIGYAEKERQ